MNLDREYLTTRLASLQALQAQNQANVHLTQGHIGEVQHMLAQLDAQEQAVETAKAALRAARAEKRKAATKRKG